MLSVLDSAVVSELREVMGEEFPVLIETFVHDGGQRLRELREAAGAHETLRRNAHGLKGSAANLGAIRVVELCAHLEGLARRESEEGLTELIAALDAEFEAACEGLRRFAAE